jgi:hypothetical protein
LAAAGRKIGVNATTIFRWIERSRNDDPEFIVTWCGVEAQFADHVRKAIKMSVALIESQARTFALAGWDEPVVFQGKQCFVEDERCAGIDPDSFERLGLPLDGMKRDADSNRIPLTVRRKPSDALVTLMLRAST